eukprot:3859444-Alexandrium_andersonii.AAC.1
MIGTEANAEQHSESSRALQSCPEFPWRSSELRGAPQELFGAPRCSLGLLNGASSGDHNLAAVLSIA